MFISILLYIILIAGLIITFSNSFMYISYRAKTQGHVNTLKPKVKKQKSTDAFEKHIYMLLQITFGAKHPDSVYMFAMISGLTAMVGWFLTIFILPTRTAVFIAFICLFIPYIYLRTRLQNHQVKLSHEGEVLVTELLNNYKISHYNIKEAIELTAISLHEAPLSKRTLYDLARNLNTAASKEEIKDAVDVFKYSIGTSWANILSSNIYFAQVDGTEITNSLQDLADAIIKARKAVEANKRENSEGNIMIKYLVPVIYAGTILGAVYFYDFTIEKFISYQILTPTGASWFVGIIGSYIAGIALSSFLTRSKMDI